MALTRIQFTWTASIISLLLFIGLTYQGILNNTFILDDKSNILDIKALHIDELSLENIISATKFSHTKNRILPNATFAIDWWRGNGNPRPFLWTNIIIHGANALMVFFLIHLCLQHIGRLDDTKVIIIAGLSTALWATHPIQLQGVTYIVQRMASMATFFMLLSIYSYLHARLRSSNKTIWLIISTIAIGFALLCKEIAYITPFIILLAEYSICRNNTTPIKSRIDSWLIAVPAFVLAYVIIDIASESGPLSSFIKEGYNKRDFTLEERLLTQPRVIFFHLSQILFPLPERFSIEHDFSISKSLFSPITTFLSLIGLVFWCGFGIKSLFKKGHRHLGFFILWFPAALIIESSVIPLEVIFEHRMYFPSIALFALAGVGLQEIILKNRFNPYCCLF